MVKSLSQKSWTGIGSGSNIARDLDPNPTESGFVEQIDVNPSDLQHSGRNTWLGGEKKLFPSC